MGLRINIPGSLSALNAILVSLDRFDGFLGLGPVRPRAGLSQFRQT